MKPLLVLSGLLILTTLMGGLTGCAGKPVAPAALQLDHQARAITRSEGGVRVLTSVLSAQEGLAVYGVPLAEKGIQPVWIEVENRDDVAYWLMSPGLDPDFFPASEAADAFAAEGDRTVLEQSFRDLAFRNPVPAGGHRLRFRADQPR